MFMWTFFSRFLKHSNYFLDIFSNSDKVSLLHMLLIHVMSLMGNQCQDCKRCMLALCSYLSSCWAACCFSNRSNNNVGNSQKDVPPFPGWDKVTFCSELQAKHFGASSGSFNLNETRKLCLYLLQMSHSLRAVYTRTTLSGVFFSFETNPFT